MVCSSGSGRMEVMARLLAAETFSQNVPDNFAPQKSAADYICRELREADEANLLDGEDMQVYGERPMADMLQLVCCHVCKKTIKDSQYAAHAELCRSLMLTEPTSLELNCSTGNRKSARKAKNKLSTSCAYQATAVGERRRSDTTDNVVSVVSKSYLSSQIRVTSFSIEAKGHSTFVDAAFMMDDKGIIPGSRDHPALIMHPPTESHKVFRMTSTHLSLPESRGTKSGVTKFMNFADGIIRSDLLEGTVSEHGCPNHKDIGPVHEQHVTNNDFPAPLATKMYYSQRNNRLRAAIRHLYFQELSDNMWNDAVSPNASHGEMLAFEDPCQKDPSFDQIDNVINKSHSPTLCSAQNSGHILAKSSEVCLLKGGALPSSGLSNQFLVDNVSRSAATHVLMRNNFLPKSYAFANNSGPMQQPNGSVPVI
ncbi:PREDICTED: uncharacterized protein LOC109329690 isoform X2 [Lupinus angustifolius]|uniref:uncharacterized protein LOC109329690 isoform X2 n=1 Tax=Lupinus angustifolius TaxID=3871 RepID=UPI00092E2748|nr:PREDICTED: uncharacterized protein LOC109329690 isoform X2 [Lupinus angustifolius]